MTNVLFIVALLCACVGAWRGCRTAWAMIAGTATAAYFVASGVPYSPALWLMIDIAVMNAIIAFALMGRGITPIDWLVIMLFLPSGALYFRDELWAVQATDIIVSVQLLLTAPLPWVQLTQSLHQLAHRGRSHGNGISRVAQCPMLIRS